MITLSVITIYHESFAVGNYMLTEDGEIILTEIITWLNIQNNEQ